MSIEPNFKKKILNLKITLVYSESLKHFNSIMYLIFDTETTGLPKRWGAPISDTDNWPRIQIAWQLHDDMGKVIEHQDYLVKPEGFNIPYDAERIHGISQNWQKPMEFWQGF
jgi:DNA polymerase III alpha subunit (gram-positive type)